MAHLLRVLEIDRVDLEQREIALALLGAADDALDRVAGAQPELPDLRGRDIDVVGPGEIIGVGRAQEAEAVLQHLDDALADDLDVAARELLQDREEQLLLSQERGVLHLMLFREGQQLGRGLGFEIGKLDFPHGDSRRRIGHGLFFGRRGQGER